MQSHSIPTSAADIMAEAVTRTGIDIVDHDIAEALTVALRSLNSEARLSRQGALDMEQRLIRLLCNRLRMLRDLRDHPEIEQQEIRKPVFLTGGPRTGSTKLHRFLSASGDFLYVQFWQAHTLSLLTGDRSESPTPRIKESSDYIQWVHAKAPSVRYVHDYGTFDPEEDTLIYEHGLFGFFIASIANVPTFMQWYLRQDLEKVVGFLKQAIQYLQWQFHDGDPRRWLLKYPGHQGLEPVLKKVFPGAAFITTNRDPVALVPSACSLTIAYHGMYSDADWRIPMGQGMVEGQKMRGLMHVQAREDDPQMNVMDIAYPDLLRRPEKIISDIYGFLGMDVSLRAKTAMLEWDAQNEQNKFGSHRYTLEEFGLTADQIRSALKPYIDRFGHYF